jgi:hypothetical protein
LRDWPSAVDHYQSLQRHISTTSLRPNFLIRGLESVYRTVESNVADAPDLIRLSEQLRLDAELFSLIQKCQSDPSAFANDRHSKIDWFVDSDEDDVVPAASGGLNDRDIASELTVIESARRRGDIATTSRLGELLSAVIDKTLEQHLRQEVWLTIAESPPDSPIAQGDWDLVMGELRGAPAALLERLSKDIWARSVDSRLLFTAETAAVLPNIDDLLIVMKDVTVVEVQMLRLLHLHNREDISGLALSVLRSQPPLRLRLRAALFLAINLAIRGSPAQAAAIVRQLPVIPPDMPLERVLYNRAVTQIGIAAFSNGLYELARESLSGAASPSELGQMPPLYPPWMLIDTQAIDSAARLSAMLLDATDAAITEGNWRQAFRAVEDDVGRCGEGTERFLEDLKKVCLGCWLRDAGKVYANVAIEFVARKFELAPEVVANIIKQVLKGVGPVTQASVEFKGQFLGDKEFLAFTTG